MNGLVFRLEVRRSRAVLIALTLTTVLYAGFIAGYYPSLAADTALVDQMLKSFPTAMKAAFGLEGNLAEQGTYLNVYLLSMLWPLVAAIAAIVIPTRTIAADFDRGFLELTLATPIARRRYLATAIAAQVVAIAVLVATMILTILIVFAVVGVAFDPGRYALVGLLAIAFGCAIAAVTTLVSVLTLQRGVAAGAVAGILVLMYLAQTVAKLNPGVDAIAWLSAFRYFAPAAVINVGQIPWDGLGLFVALAVAAWAVAVWRFGGRDLLA
jgi:ABC-2 type transport system permease protein